MYQTTLHYLQILLGAICDIKLITFVAGVRFARLTTTLLLLLLPIARPDSPFYSSCNFNSMCSCIIDQNDVNTKTVSCLSVPLYKLPSEYQKKQNNKKFTIILFMEVNITSTDGLSESLNTGFLILISALKTI